MSSFVKASAVQVTIRLSDIFKMYCFEFSFPLNGVLLNVSKCIYFLNYAG